MKVLSNVPEYNRIVWYELLYIWWRKSHKKYFYKYFGGKQKYRLRLRKGRVNALFEVGAMLSILLRRLLITDKV